MSVLGIVLLLVFYVLPIAILVFGPVLGVTLLVRVTDGSVGRWPKLGVSVAITLFGLLIAPRFVAPAHCGGGAFCGFYRFVGGILNLMAMVAIGGLACVAGVAVPDPADGGGSEGFRRRLIGVGGLTFVALLCSILFPLLTSVVVPTNHQFARQCGGNLLCRMQLGGAGLLMILVLAALIFVGPFVVAAFLAILWERG